MIYPKYNFDDPNLNYNEVNLTVNAMYDDFLSSVACCSSKGNEEVLLRVDVIRRGIVISDPWANTNTFDNLVKQAYLLLYPLVNNSNKKQVVPPVVETNLNFGFNVVKPTIENVDSFPLQFGQDVTPNPTEVTVDFTTESIGFYLILKVSDTNTVFNDWNNDESNKGSIPDGVWQALSIGSDYYYVTRNPYFISLSNHTITFKNI